MPNRIMVENMDTVSTYTEKSRRSLYKKFKRCGIPYKIRKDPIRKGFIVEVNWLDFVEYYKRNPSYSDIYPNYFKHD